MRPEKHSAERSADLFSENIYRLLLPGHLQLIPGLNEVYELELAFYESRILADEDIIRRGAYFAQVSERPTYHTLICSGEALQTPSVLLSKVKSSSNRSSSRLVMPRTACSHIEANSTPR